MTLSRKTPPIARSEAGFTLIELMVAMSIFAVLLGASLSLLATAENNANRDSETATAATEAQTGLEKMVRDLRQATSVVVTDPNTFEIVAGSQQVRYRCDVPDPKDSRYRQCVRSAGTAGTSPADASGSVVVGRLLNGTATRPVFSYTAPAPPETDEEDEADEAGDTPAPLQPTYVTAVLAVPADGGKQGGYKHEIVLDTGFYLRNVDYAGSVS